MGVNFRKRVEVAPGVKLNFSKSGVSTTIGTKGGSVNIGQNGTYLNGSIPGTGLYARQKVSSNGKSNTAGNSMQGSMSVVEWIMWVSLIFWMFMSIPCVLFPHYEKVYIFAIAAIISLVIFWILWFTLKDEQ